MVGEASTAASSCAPPHGLHMQVVFPTALREVLVMKIR
jgi:hypothetical protein